MSYIIYNNKKSDEIPGLIISELPPITKPEMRTEIITIDGKDGDVIENLGYSSYTKEIKIGLSKNYDINQVIKYFNDKGSLTLSNEPDKVYQVSISSQIDYQNLLRFKTAKVKFHVQPYKYKLNEPDVNIEISDETSIKVTNIGLEKAKPIFHLYGTGQVAIYVNNIQIFKYDFDEDEEVIINSEEEDAYLDNKLKNRNMIGEFPVLDVGENIITWTGNLSRIIITPKSRWL